MSLIRNIGIGDVVYNPFYHYVPDGDEWVRRLEKFDLMPKAEWWNGVDEVKYRYVFQAGYQLCLFVNMKSSGEWYSFGATFDANDKSVCVEAGFNWYLKQLQKKYPRAFVGKTIYNHKWLYFIK
mgnify:CR=1 FL=1